VPAAALAVVEPAGDVSRPVENGIASAGQNQELVLVRLGGIEVLAFAERLDFHCGV
jgi:hypothetical protein